MYRSAATRHLMKLQPWVRLPSCSRTGHGLMRRQARSTHDCVNPLDKLQELLLRLQDAGASFELQTHVALEVQELQKHRAVVLADFLSASDAVLHSSNATQHTATLQQLSQILWGGKEAAKGLDEGTCRRILTQIQPHLTPKQQVLLFAPVQNATGLNAEVLCAAAAANLAAGYCSRCSQKVRAAEQLLRRVALLQALSGSPAVSRGWRCEDVAMGRAVCAILVGQLGEAAQMLRATGHDVVGSRHSSWPGLKAATEMYMAADSWLEGFLMLKFPAEDAAGKQEGRMERWLQSTPLLCDMPLTPVAQLRGKLQAPFQSLPLWFWAVLVAVCSTLVAVLPGFRGRLIPTWKLPLNSHVMMCSSIQAVSSSLKAHAMVKVSFAFETPDRQGEWPQEDAVPSPDSSSHRQEPVPEPEVPPPPPLPPPPMDKSSAANFMRRWQATKTQAWSHGCGDTMISHICTGRQLRTITDRMKRDKQEGIHRVITTNTIKVNSVLNPEPLKAIVMASLEETHFTAEVEPQEYEAGQRAGNTVHPPGTAPKERGPSSSGSNSISDHTSGQDSGALDSGVHGLERGASQREDMQQNAGDFTPRASRVSGTDKESGNSDLGVKKPLRGRAADEMGDGRGDNRSRTWFPAVKQPASLTSVPSSSMAKFRFNSDVHCELRYVDGAWKMFSMFEASKAIRML